MSKDQLNSDCVALVTGASSGIGAALVEALHARGVRVIAAARRRDRLEALAGRLDEAVTPLELDVASAASIETLLERTPAAFRPVTILINNAGHDVGGGVPFQETALSSYEATVATNLLGLMQVTRMVLPDMLGADKGDIVNIGSVTARRASKGLAAYTATKHGVHGFTESLRADLASTPIRVMEILPGVVRTGFAEARLSGDAEKATAFYERFPSTLSPDHVAQCVMSALDMPRTATVAEILLVPTIEA